MAEGRIYVIISDAYSIHKKVFVLSEVTALTKTSRRFETCGRLDAVGDASRPFQSCQEVIPDNTVTTSSGFTRG